MGQGNKKNTRDSLYRDLQGRVIITIKNGNSISNRQDNDASNDDYEKSFGNAQNKRYEYDGIKVMKKSVVKTFVELSPRYTRRRRKC